MTIETHDEGHELSVFEISEAQNATRKKLSEARDQNELVRLGKKPVLKRNFGFMSILGFSCTVLITWEGNLVLFLIGLQNGGPAGIVYGFILIWLGNLSVFTALSELVSMAPTSGGQYHWVSMLAPPSNAKFLSYITGWLTICGWQGFVASGGYLTGTLIQGLIALTVPSYTPHRWQGTLLYWATILFAVFVNTIIGRLLPKFEGFILILHILGFVAILVPLVILGPHQTAPEVFNTWLNGGGWPTQGLSFFVGLLGNAFAFLGADGAFHMSEEIHNPSLVIPRSIILSIVLNGTMGFAMVIALLFCIGDINAALNTNTGYPFMEIFLQATNSVAGAAVMASLLTILSICAILGVLASASRMLWSFARDRGVPGWRILQRVSPKTTIPLWSIAVTTVASCSLALINIGSATAFNDVVSLTVSGLYTSYLICASLLLYRRVTGGIRDVAADPALANTKGAELVWGLWHVPGVLGIANNIFACIYLTIILFFSFWPPVTPVEAKTMNYNILVEGSVMIFSLVYYLFWPGARHEWDGPVIETRDHI